MRKIILILALSGASVPALAEPHDDLGDRRAARAEQQHERATQAPRGEAPREVRMSGQGRGGWQRPEAAPVAQRPQGERPMPGGSSGFLRNENARAIDPAQLAHWRERQEQNRAQQAMDGTVAATRWSDHARPPAGYWNQQRLQGQAAPIVRYGNGSGAQRQWDGNRSHGQWQGSQQARQWNGSRDGQRWSNEWRRDPRYDWQRYRNDNRSIFRIGNYYDPFGWGYRPLSIGFTLYSGYYQPNYWLDDPWQYRLPPVYGPYRWVRYYDDAVLVDIYSGEVVDVIQGFFW